MSKLLILFKWTSRAYMILTNSFLISLTSKWIKQKIAAISHLKEYSKGFSKVINFFILFISKVTKIDKIHKWCRINQVGFRCFYIFSSDFSIFQMNKARKLCYDSFNRKRQGLSNGTNLFYFIWSEDCKKK